MGVVCSTYGDGSCFYRVLVGIPEGKRPLGKHRRRWVDNIKKDFQNWRVGLLVGSCWFWIGTGGWHL